MLSAGDLLQGRYRVSGLLGRGGMGAVYEAFDERLNIQVALKECMFDKPEVIRQFEREARLLAGLRHSSLTRVFDHFVETGTACLVMEYIPGDDLGAMLREGRTFELETVLEWTDGLLAALEYLHSRTPPVIHRDIKPQNLKLISGNEIILLDFGLAKGYAGQTTLGDVSRSVFGYTPNYAPLEQIQGTEGTDARSDLYSLAATVCHLLTGTQPPGVLTRLGKTSDGLPDPLERVESLNPRVPAAVGEVIAQAMSISRERRPASAAEMREALRRARAGDSTLSSETISAGTTLPSLTTIPAASASAAAPHAQVAAPTERRRGAGWLMAIAVVLLLVSATVIGIMSINRAEEPLLEESRSDPLSGTAGVKGETTGSDVVEEAGAVRVLTAHEETVRSVAWSANGTLVASASWDGTARVWSTSDQPALLATIARDGATLNSVAFSPDDSMLAVAGYDATGSTITFHDPRTGASVREPIRDPSGLAGTVLFSPDGSRLYGTISSRVRVWDMGSGQMVLSIDGNANPSLAISPDGSRLALGSTNENVLKIFDARSGEMIRELPGHGKGLLSVAFSPNGDVVASGSYDSSVRVWSLATGDLIRGNPHPDLDVPFSIAFHPQRDLIASGSYRMVRIWNAASGARAGEFSTKEAGIVHSLAYSPDGNLLAAATSGGNVLIIRSPASE